MRRGVLDAFVKIVLLHQKEDLAVELVLTEGLVHLDLVLVLSDSYTIIIRDYLF